MKQFAMFTFTRIPFRFDFLYFVVAKMSSAMSGTLLGRTLTPPVIPQ